MGSTNNTDGKINAYERLKSLFDEGEYTELNALATEKESTTGVITAFGKISGRPAYAFSQDKTVCSGAVGLMHAQKISKLYELAAKTGAPVVAIHDSNGAFIDGTVTSLTAYGEILSVSARISGVVPHIAVVAGVCAGSAAMLACSADIVIMTKDSELFMAPPFDNGISGSSESAAKSGVASLICDDDASAIESARNILALLPSNNLSNIPVYDFTYTDLTGTDFKSFFDTDSEIELSADFGISAYTALASIEGKTVGVAAAQSNSKLSADDCAKLARFVRFCDAFSVPLITFVDTEGFEASSKAEIAGSIRDTAKLANCYAEATTVKIAVVTGKAIGSAYIALAGKNANSDFTFAYENAVISPLAPLTAVEFLWHDKLKGEADIAQKRSLLEKEYCETIASSKAAAEKGCIDAIIAPQDTRKTLISALSVLEGKRVSGLPKKHNNIPF